jgi:biopolymer transport protein ExbB/TolQ
MLTLFLVASLHAADAAKPPPAATTTAAPAPAAAPATPAVAAPVASAPTPAPAPVAASAEKAHEGGLDMSPAGLWKSMGTGARAVFFVMIGMLVWSVYVAIDRVLLFTRARGQSRDLAANLAKPLAAADLDGALGVAAKDGYKLSYLGALIAAGLKEYKERPDSHGVEAAKRELERVAIEEQANLRRGMNVLATTGSTTPFVGLVGTIFGIINSFAMMNQAGGGDLTAISGGIAEALVSTAVGIAVAITAIWIYNYFNAVIDDMVKDMTTATQQLVNFLEKDSLRRSESTAAK